MIRFTTRRSRRERTRAGRPAELVEQLGDDAAGPAPLAVPRLRRRIHATSSRPVAAEAGAE
jgi:hypothetical protein